MRCTVILGSVLVLSGCAGISAVDAPRAELAGQVLRGPIRPVCIATEPCEAPFSAIFFVYRAGRLTGTFRSDIEGRFRLALAPGVYAVQPGLDAPIISPQSQVREVLVQPQPITTVELHFDTGIR